MEIINLNLEDGLGTVSVVARNSLEAERIRGFMKEASDALSASDDPVPHAVWPHQKLAELLFSIGWLSPCDAQWHGLRDNLPKIRAMLD